MSGKKKNSQNKIIRKGVVRKSSRKRNASRRRKPKVVLSSKALLTLTVIIVLLCVAFLALNAIYTPKSNVDPVNRKETVQNNSKTESIQGTEGKQGASAKSSSVSDVQSNVEKKSAASKDNASPKKENDAKSSEKADDSLKPAENKPQSSQSASKSKDNSEKSVKDTSSQKIEDNQKKSPFDIPMASNGAELIFVIDDAGLNVANVKRYAKLPFPITIAVLPKLSHSKDCAYVVRSNQKELILHQPMQAKNLNVNPGAGAILPDMSTIEIAEIIKENLEEIGPKVRGMNNHEGSLISENEIKIGAVLEVALEKNIYFLDSRTTAQTKAPQAALERDMTIYERDVFIDDIVNREEMLKQIYRGLTIANKKGKVIMIGHVDKSVNILPDLLLEMYPYLVEKGYSFATPSTSR